MSSGTQNIAEHSLKSKRCTRDSFLLHFAKIKKLSRSNQSTYMIKQIMIPVAAFAVTVTGASAFGGNGWLENADLSDKEQAAFEQAVEVRGDSRGEAKEIFEAAGIDNARMQEIRAEMREARQVSHESVKTALDAEDYDAFLDAVEDSPLAEKITSEANFEKFVEAHELMQSGDKEGAKEIMNELGVEGPRGGGHKGGHGGKHEGGKQGFSGSDRGSGLN